MNSKPVLIVGDPHGEWGPMYDACAALSERVGSIVLLGDMELKKPLKKEISEIFDAGWTVHYIVGNHDSDTCPQYMNLMGDHPGGHLGGRVTRIEGVQVAGVSGIFKGKVWKPPEKPDYKDRKEWLRMNAPKKWRDGLPIHMRCAIFPEDFEALKYLKADVLVSHEGPSSVHKGHGFEVLDGLAKAMSARLIIHGHHHHASPVKYLPNGVAVKSMGRAEVWELAEGFSGTVR